MNLCVARAAAVVVCAALAASAQSNLPPSETLSYEVEWRLIHAGNAKLGWNAEPVGGWRATLALESVGLVSRLYKVNNEYSSHFNDRLCIQNSLLKTNEGKKRTETTVTYEEGKAKYVERDLVKNRIADSHEIDIRPCEHDVVGALYTLRTLNIPLGQSVQIPISDGKKVIMGRVDAQQRENVKIEGVEYKTIRYEAYLFNGVLYRRSGRLFIWLTDDDRRLPVQIRVRMPFYIGTVTLQLNQEGKTQ
ncbi:MAG TPA: DUF3108 domain-containing protein [Bryobacteraceae bacterium]|nr:DUF3108 domain-containing protein [Bryobacteraceae bacterium]